MDGVNGLGKRVAERLEIAGLTQGELGSMLASNRRQTWVSGVIKGRFRPSYEDAYQMAQIFKVTPMWLIYGEEGAEGSEFLGRMQMMEPDLDPRARINILKLAESEVDQARAARINAEYFDEFVTGMVASNVSRTLAIQLWQSLGRPLPPQAFEDPPAEEDPSTGEQRGA